MKRLFFILFLLLSVAQGANVKKVHESALLGSLSLNSLFGSLEGIKLEGTWDYIPDYGLHYSFAYSTAENSLAWRAAMLIARDFLEQDSGFIEGLDRDDWVSVSYSSKREVIVRMKPRQPDTLEIWVDGERW